MTDLAYFVPRDDDLPPAGYRRFAADQQRLNLAWLIEPRLDTEGLACLINNPIARSIGAHFDVLTRDALKKLPLEFMKYWRQIDDGDLAITEGWPPHYLQIMQRRARAWQREQQIVSESGNVIRIDFRKRA